MTPLVLVHGFMGGSAQWGGQVEALSDTYDVIALDLPGFGKNAHLPVIRSIGGFADWVMATLDSMGVNRFHLLGHSMGGMIVQEIAGRSPARIEKLVLYATGAMGVLPGRFETIAESKTRARADGARTTARRIAATWFCDGEAASGYDACAAIAEQTTVDAILAGLDAMQAWSNETALPDLEIDTLVIWGDCDRTYQWEQTELLWKSIPKANLAVVPACAHAIHLEQPEAFNLLLRTYLEGGA
ncbi:alpha/beta fold hydrolase [Roseobacter sp. A03A-229]